MAKEIKWGRLSQSETETLAELVKSGEAIYPAPIEISDDPELRKTQFESLGIGWADCKTWYVGSKKILVYLTPANKTTYDLLLGDLRARHREAFRRCRCQIPGKLKPTIPCPECNSCAACPYPQYRDQHKANNLSWEGLIESSFEKNYNEDYDGDPTEDPKARQTEVRMELDAVCKAIDAKNPLFTKAIVLKEYYGFSVDEIAEKLGTTRRNVYYYIDEAKKIGRKFREENA